MCQFSAGADAGPCSGTAGILDYQEITDVITQYNLDPIWDKTAGVKWITWKGNQWVSYDDDDTFAQKKASLLLPGDRDSVLAIDLRSHSPTIAVSVA